MNSYFIGLGLSVINLIIILFVYFDARSACKSGSSAYPGLVGLLYGVFSAIFSFILGLIGIVVFFDKFLNFGFVSLAIGTIIPLIIYVCIRKKIYSPSTSPKKIQRWSEYIFWILFILSTIGAVDLLLHVP